MTSEPVNDARDPGPGAGIGLRAPHVAEVIATRPATGWLEVHTENYLGGGPAVKALMRVRRDYPVSLHGVGLSLGSAEGLDACHLARVRSLVDRLEPALVSEHLSWSIAGGVYLNHLLPLPYTAEALALVGDHVDQAQEALGRRLLIENPSSYLRFAASTLEEPAFLGEIARRTGCALLCDVNNAFVSCRNFGLDPVAWLDALPAAAVAEIHLAGHARGDADGQVVLIDDHGSRVADEVWALYAHALRRFGPVPVLVEWDTDLPPLPVLLEEAATAARIARRVARATGTRASARAAADDVQAAGARA
jgi:uncharacterized protein (UPF0276 family)